MKYDTQPAQLHSTPSDISPKFFVIATSCLSDSELAPSPQLRPKNIQHKHPNNPNNTQPSQNTDTLPHSQINKKRSPKQDTPACKRAPQEIIPSEQTRCILWITQRDIDENTLHNDEHRCTVDRDPDGGYDPMDRCARRPTEEEETDGGTETGK